MFRMTVVLLTDKMTANSSYVRFPLNLSYATNLITRIPACYGIFTLSFSKMVL